MKQRALLSLLFAALALSLAAQQTSESFVAKGGGQQQVFLLEDNPRLTVTIEDGEPVFTVRDLRNRVMNGVTTCIFSETPLSPDITLQENENNDYYTRFAKDYNGVTVTTATLNRRFVKERWSTLCLPFNVNKAMLSSLNFGSRIYEFKYATGNADEGINLYFSIAKSIEAGKGYIVNADERLAARTSFTFPGVKIDLSADKGEELNSVAAYDNLEGWSAEGDIELVGTLRKGILHGASAGNTYMGLKENMIYYPNIATGSTILAYRGIFRSKTGTLNAGRVRIVVDGVKIGELRMDNGQLQENNDAVKYIHNGILYIERNGKTYNAQGQVID